MTFEEIQRIIEGMLAVQRELQDSQLKLQEESLQQREEAQRQREEAQQQREEAQRQREDISTLVESIKQLIVNSERHDRRIEQLIGYSITGESDRLDLQQEVNDLKRRVERLENQER